MQNKCSCTCCALCSWFAFLVVLLAWLLSIFVRESDPSQIVGEGSLGPFCFHQDGKLKCQSKRRLCGCASGSCENGGGVDREALSNLNLTEGLVRMVTFRNEMKIPKSIAGPMLLIGSPVVWLLGGTIKRQGDGSRTVLVPSHTWSEVELPHSNCYLMLGGQTSTFRDRGIHGFRLVLHDTTFRFWEREVDKLAYDVMLLHRLLRLSPAHVRVLKRLINFGDRRHVSAGQDFERNLDQDFDLSPVFLELPPAKFVFHDNAVVSMLMAYFRLFGLYHRIVTPFTKPAFNCVVMALLFGRDPSELLSLVPLHLHESTRAKALELNERWQHNFAPIFERADHIFRAGAEIPQPTEAAPWWQCLLLRQWLEQPKPEHAVSNFQQQIDRARPNYLKHVMLPLKNELTQYDPDIEKTWADKFALADDVLEYRLDDFEMLRSQTSDGCDAKSAVDQLLFCPDWQRAEYWLKAKSGRRSGTMDVATLLKETNIAVRKLLYWSAAKGINGETEIPRDLRLVRSCMSRGGLNQCLDSST